MSKSAHFNQQVQIFIGSIFPFTRRFCVAFLCCLFIFSLKLKPVEMLPLSQLLSDLSKQPFTLLPHIRLAHLYLTTGNARSAYQEWNTAQYVSNRPVEPIDVLGETLEYAQVKKQLEENPEDIKRVISYWQKTALAYPNYRDSWVQLAFLAFNNGEINEVKNYLNKIKALDSNYNNSLPPELKSLW